MKILLVKPISEKATNITPSLGLGYLAGALKEHDVTYLDCVKEKMDFEKFEIDLILKNYFDVVGIQYFTCDHSSVMLMAKIIKIYSPETKVVVGGPHVSGFPDCVKDPNIDYGFIGEAEVGFPQLLKQNFKDPYSVPGLVTQLYNKLIINKPNFEEDIDKFEVAWDLIKPEEYPIAPHGSFVRTPPSAPIMTTRGCPYNCQYCAGKKSTGDKLRKRSVENIYKEIFNLYERRIREIHIEDDNFTLDKEFAMRFCRTIINVKTTGELKDLSFACPNGVRLETLDEELLKKMEEAGFYSFAIGIESGNNRILKKMGRNITKEKIREKVELIARTTNIKMTGFCMMGYPTETIEEMEETAEFTRSLPIHKVQYGNFHPLPGTSIFDELVKDGYNPEDKWDNYQDNTISYSPKGVTPEQLKKTMEKAFKKFYFRPRIIFGMLREIKNWTQFKILFKRGIESFGG